MLVISPQILGLRFVAANGQKDGKSSPMTPTILDRSASFTTWLEEDTALEPKSWRSDQLCRKEVDIPIKLSNSWFYMYLSIHIWYDIYIYIYIYNYIYNINWYCIIVYNMICIVSIHCHRPLQLNFPEMLSVRCRHLDATKSMRSSLAWPRPRFLIGCSQAFA